MTDHKNRDVNLLDEAANNEKVNIVADAVMSRTREKDFKETIRHFHHTVSELQANVQLAKREVLQAAEQKITVFPTQFPSCETIPNSLNAKFRKQQSRRSQRFESARDKPLNQSRQHA